MWRGKKETPNPALQKKSLLLLEREDAGGAKQKAGEKKRRVMDGCHVPNTVIKALCFAGVPAD